MNPNLPRRVRPLPFIVLAILSLGLAGCVSHQILIHAPASEPASARYTLEGDSLDVFDGRLPHPAGPGWVLASREVGEDSTGNLVGRLVYEATSIDSLPHPLAPLGAKGFMAVTRSAGWFRNTVGVHVEFPAWHASERYGDPDQHLPDEMRALQQSGAEDLLTAEQEDELERWTARARQLATVDRYLRQLERAVRAVTADPDTAVVRDAVSRFSPVLRAHLLSLQGDPVEPVDPRDISLEWYPELRQMMASAGMEATGLPYETVLAATDSLEHEYKRWVDLEDDTVELLVVLPGMNNRMATPDPHETRGDTLVWTLERDDVADLDLVITAAGYQWRTGAIYGAIAGALFGIMAASMLRRKRAAQR